MLMAEIDWILMMNFAQRSGGVLHFLVEPHGRLLGVNFLHISRPPARTAGHVARVQPAATKQFAPGSVLAFILLTFSRIHPRTRLPRCETLNCRAWYPFSFICWTETTQAPGLGPTLMLIRTERERSLALEWQFDTEAMEW